MNKDFEKLYNICVAANAVSWANSTMPTGDCDTAENMMAMMYDKQLKSYMKKHPSDVISTYNARFDLPTKMNKKFLSDSTELWNKYQSLKKDKSEPDTEYYRLLQDAVDNHKRAMDHYKMPVGELSYMNDHALGGYQHISSVVESMVGVHRDFIKRGNSSPIIAVPSKQFTKEGLMDYIAQFEWVEAIFSGKNGSFMTSLDATNARIHIFDEKDINEVAGSVFHEVGHAAYQTQVLSKLPIGKLGGCVSMSLHESCSLYFELSLSNNRFAVDRLHSRNLKRLSADRIHYIFHIWIRMVIEKEIFDGTLNVTDIPGRWDELMLQYFGQKPTNVWDGFMQDVHWNSSMFGYFFSYAIGFVNAVSKFQETKHLLTGDAVVDTNEVLVPHILGKYGNYDESSSDLLSDLKIDIGAYRSFVFDYFYVQAT